MTDPVVTILMPVHNGETYLALALESILAQTMKDFQCLVLDDGSTDRTPEILACFATRDPRIQSITLKKSGLVTTLNTGLDLVKTEWVARLDADDLMVPERLERQLAFVNSHPNIAVAASYVRYIDKDGRTFGEGRSRFTTTEAVEDALQSGDLIGLHHPSIIARTQAMREMHGYREEAWLAEDTDLWTRMAEEKREVLVQPEFLTHYRVHGSSVSRKKMETQNLVVAWLKLCLRCRQQGTPAPTWQAFLDDRARQPVTVKLDRWRRSKAKNLYKEATLSYARRAYLTCGTQLAISLLLQPSHAFKQLRSKKISALSK